MSQHKRIYRLAEAIRCFLTPGDDYRERLCTGTSAMTSETMAAGLDASLSSWDETGIAALCSEEEAYMRGGVAPELVAVILGGVLPPSHIQAIAYPYLLGAEVIVKHSSADPLFPSLLANALGDGVTVMGRLGFGGVLSRADAIVAVGDDESILAIQKEVAVATPFLGFGHRSAIDLVCGSVIARSNETAVEVARDIALFDQLGCLSPREVLVIGTPEDALVLAENIALHMADLPPRVALEVSIEAAIRGTREVARALGRTVLGPDDLQWGITVEEMGQWTGTPGGRQVIVRSLSKLGQIPETLATIQGHLSAVGVAGGDLDPATQRALIRLGASRIVPVGTLQTAPPTWPHDGRRPLASLCRWCGAG
jgi:hypothetical protein